MKGDIISYAEWKTQTQKQKKAGQAEHGYTKFFIHWETERQYIFLVHLLDRLGCFTGKGEYPNTVADFIRGTNYGIRYVDFGIERGKCFADGTERHPLIANHARRLHSVSVKDFVDKIVFGDCNEFIDYYGRVLSKRGYIKLLCAGHSEWASENTMLRGALKGK